MCDLLVDTRHERVKSLLSVCCLLYDLDGVELVFKRMDLELLQMTVQD